MEITSLYIKLLEIFHEHKIPYFDAAQQLDTGIARYFLNIRV